MSAKKGSNGIMDGEDSVRKYLDWLRNVDDFKPYIRQGTLNVSKVAREAKLHRDVFYTNQEIRDTHWPALNKRLEEEGVLKPRVANPVETIRPPTQQSSVSEARIKQIQEENAAVKAENQELRKQLEKFNGINDILLTTGRLPW